MHVIVGMICAHSNIYPGTLVTGIYSGNVLTLSHPTMWSHDGDYAGSPVSKLTFTPNSVLDYTTLTIGIEASARNVVLSSPNAIVSTGMFVTHPNIWAGTFVHSIVGSTIVLSHPCKRMDHVGYIVATNKEQKLTFIPSVLTFNTDAIGIVAKNFKITIGTSSSKYANRWPGYIIAGMGIVHANVLPGTVVDSVSNKVGLGMILKLSQATLSTVASAVGLQEMHFTPLTVTTDTAGVRSGTAVVTMSAPSNYINSGMVVVHSNVLPGTTVVSLRGVILKLSKPALAVGDVGYVSAAGIQTLQFKPLTFTTNYIGIRAKSRKITMSMSNDAIVAGMIVLHPCLVAGTTVKSFDKLTLVISQETLSLSTKDVGYFNGSGIQTLTFFHADDAGDNAVDDGNDSDNEKGSADDSNKATPSSSSAANSSATENPWTLFDWADDEFVMITAVVSSGCLLLICLIFIAC
jgi:hypothetical protein